MLLELDPLILSRHGHHYKDPARRSFLEVVGVDRDGHERGGTGVGDGVLLDEAAGVCAKGLISR